MVWFKSKKGVYFGHFWHFGGERLPWWWRRVLERDLLRACLMLTPVTRVCTWLSSKRHQSAASADSPMADVRHYLGIKWSKSIILQSPTLPSADIATQPAHGLLVWRAGVDRLPALIRASHCLIITNIQCMQSLIQYVSSVFSKSNNIGS